MRRGSGKCMTSDIWKQFLHLIGEECGSRVVETWFKSITFCSWDSVLKTIFLEAPNTFIKEWVLKNYLLPMQIHLGRLLHVEMPRIVLTDMAASPTTIDALQVASDTSQKIIPAHLLLPSVGKPPALRRLPSEMTYATTDNNYQFETFVVGPSNSLAYAAAHAVTERPGTLYNPLFIYGKSGLGKTHLLRAIGNAIKINNNRSVVLYQSADRFVTEFINAIRFDKVHKFKDKYCHIDVLLIDDIQFISNKEQTQEAFFHIFNSLYDACKQIVFSSDTFPQNMHGIAERLQSRLAAGLVADIHLPSFETKMAIVKQKARAHGNDLNDEVAQFIASRVVSNIRELEGALIRVLAFASLMQQAISIELAHKVLHRAPATTEMEPKGSQLDSVIRIVASHYLCTPDDLYARSRTQAYVQARHVAMFLIKHLTGRSLRAIGDFFGGRDHSTVIHGLEKVANEMKSEPQFRIKVERMEREIRATLFP